MAENKTKSPPQGKDGAQYVRTQQGHSLVKHIILCFFCCWIVHNPILQHK